VKFRSKNDGWGWRVIAVLGVVLPSQILGWNDPAHPAAEICVALSLLVSLVALVAERSIYWELSPQLLYPPQTLEEQTNSVE